MKIKKNIKYGLTALAFAGILSACSAEDANQVKEKANDAEVAVEEKVDSVEDKANEKIDSLKTGLEEKDFAISLDDAVAKFKEAFPEEDIQVDKIELDEDDGVFAYDIEGFNDTKEFSISVDAESGDILSQEEETEDDTANKKAIELANIISPKDAMAKALENNTGYVKSFEIEYENDKLVYDIDVEDGDDVVLDAQTGDIINK